MSARARYVQYHRARSRSNSGVRMFVHASYIRLHEDCSALSWMALDIRVDSSSRWFTFESFNLDLCGLSSSFDLSFRLSSDHGAG